MTLDRVISLPGCVFCVVLLHGTGFTWLMPWQMESFWRVFYMAPVE